MSNSRLDIWSASAYVPAFFTAYLVFLSTHLEIT
jgi:hypothetical protein